MTNLETFHELRDQLAAVIYNYAASSRRSHSRSQFTVRWTVPQPWIYQCRSITNMITVCYDLDEDSKALLGMNAPVTIRWHYDESNELRNVPIPCFWSAGIEATGKEIQPFTIHELNVGNRNTLFSKLEQTVDAMKKTTVVRYEFAHPLNARRVLGALSFGATFEGSTIEAEVTLPVRAPSMDPQPTILKIVRHAVDTLVRLKSVPAQLTDEDDAFDLRFSGISFVIDRNKLEQHSEFFRAFLSTSFSFKERDQNFIESEYDPEVGEILQAFLCNGRIEKVKLQENLLPFMRFVHEKQFLELVDIGEVMMIQLALDALADGDIQEFMSIMILGAQLDLTMVVLFGHLIEEEEKLSEEDLNDWSEFLETEPLYSAKKLAALNAVKKHQAVGTR